ncbi:BTAD domain-containing putative transcriptional regulator [Actinomadura sp. 9N407]|uniref:BTAD domain-containing putative transcriptional regulator n=1 Tax=Actinomadura sp. 9N407 TaxID=3375154 RepID=UPI0037B04607
MRVRILGALEVTAGGGRAVAVGGARLRVLLTRLALDAGREVPGETLVRTLWPDETPGDPANALHTLVSRLRRALADEIPVRRGVDGYMLDVPRDEVDALRFERLAREGRWALREGDAATAEARFREALALWRDDALTDVPGAIRRRLAELRLATVEDRIEAELAGPAGPGELAAELEELTALHPLRERLRTLLVRVLHADGRQAEALRAYADYQRLLAEELGADPGPELQAVHLAVLRGGRDTPRSGGTNLRAPLTSFVPREEEQDRIRRCLASGRLVTLVGPGGAGKTRLAEAVAADVRVTGGVWLVELAPVTEPEDVPRAVLEALGLRGQGTGPVTARLVEALRDETLLVLDNCEHVIEAAADLATELLGRCPRLKVLATSREPLRAGGEALCPVPPLPLPGAGLDGPAMRLFADRAAAVRPGFAVDAGNAEAVAEICRRLDGLPLAIELAAARLSVLPVEALAGRLRDRLGPLTGNRGALPRHRTLDAVVGWSWGLLPEPERRLASRLSAFPGVISAEAAGAVCGLPGPAALDGLASLAGKSLLQVVEAGGEARFRMLETIREYARERLEESGEHQEAKDAHAAFFLDLAERAKPHVPSAGQLPWLRALGTERDNLLAALHHFCDSGEADPATRLGASLGLYWTIQGDHAQAATRLAMALRTKGAVSSAAAEFAIGFYLLNTLLAGGDATGGLTEVRALAAGLPNPPEGPAGAVGAAALALLGGDDEAGLDAITRVLPQPDPWTSAMLHLTRAFLHGNRGDGDAGRRDLVTAVDGFGEAGERWGHSTSLTFLAHTQIVNGDLDGAVASLEEGMRLRRELGTSGEGLPHLLLATARAHQGDFGQAEGVLTGLLASGPHAVTGVYRVLAHTTLGDLARWRGDLDGTERHQGEARDLTASLPYPARLFDAVIGGSAARLALARDDREAARRLASGSFAAAVAMPDMAIAADAGVTAAWLASRAEAQTAAELLGAAHALRGGAAAADPDIARVTGDVREVLGDAGFRTAYERGRTQDRQAALVLIEQGLDA